MVLKTIEQRIAVGSVSKKALGELQKVLLEALRRGDAETAAKAVDVLKAAYGAGLQGVNENTLLKQAFSCAMDKRFFSIAGYVLEAYRPLFRNTQAMAAKKTLVQEIGLLTVLAMRQGGNALASTAIDVLLYLAMRPDDEIAGAVVEEFRSIGMEAIRQGDGGLLLELSRRLAKAALFNGEQCHAAWLRLMETWLASINDNPFAAAGESFLPVLEAAEAALLPVEWQTWMQTWGTCLRQQVLRPYWPGCECLWQAFFHALERMPPHAAGGALSRVASGMLLLVQDDGFAAVMDRYFFLFVQAGGWLVEEARFAGWDRGANRRLLLEKIQLEMMRVVKMLARNDLLLDEAACLDGWNSLVPDRQGREQAMRFFVWLQKK